MAKGTENVASPAILFLAAVDRDLGPISDASRARYKRVFGDGTRDHCRMAAALCAGIGPGKALPRQRQRGNPEHDPESVEEMRQSENKRREHSSLMRKKRRTTTFRLSS